ncbi:hypothetical protein Thimo_1710 [Thioflavicoccus mobilis 8321]|uniref:Uncharacterized protein n=1 Tax=Thioflavicoccus mobilis 8321 TaxID=765912 RepID=L0GXE6_9GAMM|nr:hypothetical protein [Thioflavicoccus mobilis]AGA90487.1 hypothetical protein Thimo_1710 [Thioflavicoccus mobilis 8321]
MRRIAIALSLLIALMATASAARTFLDPDTEELLVEAVEAAVRLDLFHARCRSDGSNRRTENLNKMIAGKFQLTIIGVQDDLFPERSYRRAQERLQRDFAADLRAAGGCQAARDSGVAAQLAERYEELFSALERLP